MTVWPYERIYCPYHVANMEECFQNLTGKPTAENMPLGRPRRRWEDNTRMDLKK